MKAGWAGVAIAAALAAWVAGRCSRGDELGRWKQAARDALVATDAIRRRADSLAGVQAVHETTFLRARARVDTLRLPAESARVAGDTARLVQLLDSTVASCRVALEEAGFALSACDRRAALERLRGDSLERIVRVGLTVHAGRRCGVFGGIGLAGTLTRSTGGLVVAVGCRLL